MNENLLVKEHINSLVEFEKGYFKNLADKIERISEPYVRYYRWKKDKEGNLKCPLSEKLMMLCKALNFRFEKGHYQEGYPDGPYL